MNGGLGDVGISGQGDPGVVDPRKPGRLWRQSAALSVPSPHVRVSAVRSLERERRGWLAWRAGSPVSRSVPPRGWRLLQAFVARRPRVFGGRQYATGVRTQALIRGAGWEGGRLDFLVYRNVMKSFWGPVAMAIRKGQLSWHRRGAAGFRCRTDHTKNSKKKNKKQKWEAKLILIQLKPGCLELPW